MTSSHVDPRHFARHCRCPSPAHAVIVRSRSRPGNPAPHADFLGFRVKPAGDDDGPTCPGCTDCPDPSTSIPAYLATRSGPRCPGACAVSNHPCASCPTLPGISVLVEAGDQLVGQWTIKSSCALSLPARTPSLQGSMVSGSGASFFLQTREPGSCATKIDRLRSK